MENCIPNTTSTIDETPLFCETFISTDCSIFPNAISSLGLEAEATATEVISVLVTSLVTARNSLEILEEQALLYTRPYKVYSANASQNTPSNYFEPIIFENTIGNIIWSNPSDGYHLGTLEGAFSSKTWSFISPLKQDFATFENWAELNRVNDNSIEIKTYQNGVLTNFIFPNTSFEIRVYY
jgi:hypothetical protein